MGLIFSISIFYSWTLLEKFEFQDVKFQDLICSDSVFYFENLSDTLY